MANPFIEIQKRISLYKRTLGEQALGSERGLMRRLGALMLATSQRAFVEQRLGEKTWPPRYPGMIPPIINIAGALMDFKAGRSAPKPNRFQDRPALIDEGMRGGLWGSLTFQVTSPLSVDVGTTKEYAPIHMEGGESAISYDEGTKDRIRNWLFKERRKPGPRGGKYTPRKNREGYIPKLGPLLHKNEHSQNILARPFLGFTPELEDKLLRATERWIEDRTRGSGGVSERI